MCPKKLLVVFVSLHCLCVSSMSPLSMYAASGVACVRHCSVASKKHVLPALNSPAPTFLSSFRVASGTPVFHESSSRSRSFAKPRGSSFSSSSSSVSSSFLSVCLPSPRPSCCLSAARGPFSGTRSISAMSLFSASGFSAGTNLMRRGRSSFSVWTFRFFPTCLVSAFNGLLDICETCAPLSQ